MVLIDSLFVKEMFKLSPSLDVNWKRKQLFLLFFFTEWEKYKVVFSILILFYTAAFNFPTDPFRMISFLDYETLVISPAIL